MIVLLAVARESTRRSLKLGIDPHMRSGPRQKRMDVPAHTRRRDLSGHKQFSFSAQHRIVGYFDMFVVLEHIVIISKKKIMSETLKKYGFFNAF